MRNKTVIIVVISAVLLAGYQGYCADKAGYSQVEIDAMLFALKPLPKVHYSYSLYPEFLNDRNSRRLYELARIMHSLSISGEWATKQQIDNCIYNCARVNKTTPSIKASLGINFSPWHRRFGKDLPPTDRGPSYQEEIDYFEKRALLVKQWIEQSNEKYESDVEVTVVILETERFCAKAGDELWNEGIREALDTIHKKSQAIFPTARIEWYGRGVGQAAVESGWSKTRYWTGKEIKAPLSCSLYSISEMESTHETFRRTCKLADQLGISDVTPWVALASGYRRGIIKKEYWDFDWSYDIVYSYEIGAELNIDWYGENPERFAPYKRAKVVIFYPPAFDKRTPDWAEHFIAYVRGATGVTDLKDLGYQEN